MKLPWTVQFIFYVGMWDSAVAAKLAKFHEILFTYGFPDYDVISPNPIYRGRLTNSSYSNFVGRIHREIYGGFLE